MKTEQYLKNLQTPSGKIDVILDTDAYNEIDDQFAVAYMLKNPEKLNVKGICAAPFLNSKSVSPEDGMEKSYDEILKLLSLMNREDMNKLVFKGSKEYLPDETVPVESPAADFIGETARGYSPENPLYVVAIGAITNVASAILKYPHIKDNCVIVWLGGFGHHMPDGASEFNMRQDIAAARIIFGCGVPVVQLPCAGVVDHFATTKPELEYWLKGKNPLCDYLCENTINEADSYAAGRPWSRVIWDVTAVAWLLNDDNRFMKSRLAHSPIPQYDYQYAFNSSRHFICYVYHIHRDNLFSDLFKKLAE